MEMCFFKFTCENCAIDHVEKVSRIKLQWLQVVYLALYNLPSSNFGGKAGYFRWREHICGFIDKHWIDFFGPLKKKTTTWCGTVAGTLSSGCPTYFQSGSNELKEAGWWRLAEYKPPTVDLINQNKPSRRPKEAKTPPTPKPENLRSRRSKATSYKAAMELKARRMNTDGSSSKNTKLKDEAECGSIDTKDDSSDAIYRSSTPHSFYRNSSFGSSLDSELLDQDSCMSFCSNKSGSYLSTQDLSVTGFPDMMFDDDFTNSDYEVDPCSISPTAESLPSGTMLPVEQLVAAMDNKQSGDISIAPSMSEISVGEDSCTSSMISTDNTFKTKKSKTLPQTGSEEPSTDLALIKKEQITQCTDSCNSSDNSESSDDDDDNDPHCNQQILSETVMTKRRKRRRKSNKQLDQPVLIRKKKCVLMGIYDERQLLSQLQSCSALYHDNSKLCRLKRKLIVRQLKREHGLSVFNIDEEVKHLLAYRAHYQDQECDTQDDEEAFYNRHYNNNQTTNILDRYHVPQYHCYQINQSISFLNRLVGTEDDQLQSVRSPYTHRLLKPFIRRDYESRPLKMRLLMEIQAYHHRKDPSWKAPDPYPIDFCYVRPQHIASVNTLCKEFFWPHIDLAECLQYPDFSCVVLYRRFVIGFAFMVPDVDYNKAYISFVFTHPEWRNAGIATFMIYHLIQTCMGKDVTLHVSASNSAMLLYQKFGFKPQEFIQDFYDKYFPIDSTECRHAFLLRLGR